VKNFFGKIWLAWAAFTFVLSWPFVWIAYQITAITQPAEKVYKPAFHITKIWGHYVLFCLGVRVRVHGKENRAKHDQVVYVSNHRSQVDIPINFTSTPQFVILSKSEALKIPAVSTNLKLAHVTVNRKEKGSRKQSLVALRTHLSQGRSILLYPEGRRPREEVAVGEFQAGAFMLAKEFSLPIVPVTIIGSDKINNPKQPLALFPGTIEVFFEEKIWPQNHDSIEEFQNYVQQVMRTRIINETN